MNQVLPIRMTVDEFLRWSERQERGRYELERGTVISMSPQTVGHARTKADVLAALKAAIARAGVPYYALPDGLTIRIDVDRAYEPDALVAALPTPPDEMLEIPNPLIVVEVLSPTSIRRDLTTKVSGYARVPSIEHYLVIDPEAREVLHYRRNGDMLVPPEDPLSEGALRLDPPGLEVTIADMLGPASAKS